MKKRNFAFALLIFFAFASCNKDDVRDIANQQASSKTGTQNKAPAKPTPVTDNSNGQAKLPSSPIIPLLADPNAPGQFYCYYGGHRYNFSSFIHPNGPFTQGDPISSSSGVVLVSNEGSVEAYNIGVRQNEVVVKFNTWCNPPNFANQMQAYNTAVSVYLYYMSIFVGIQVDQGVTAEQAALNYQEQNPSPQLVNHVGSLYTDNTSGCTAQIFRFKMIRISSGTTYGISPLTGGGSIE